MSQAANTLFCVAAVSGMKCEMCSFTEWENNIIMFYICFVQVQIYIVEMSETYSFARNSSLKLVLLFAPFLATYMQTSVNVLDYLHSFPFSSSFNELSSLPFSIPSISTVIKNSLKLNFPSGNNFHIFVLRAAFYNVSGCLDFFCALLHVLSYPAQFSWLSKSMTIKMGNRNEVGKYVTRQLRGFFYEKNPFTLSSSPSASFYRANLAKTVVFVRFNEKEIP